MQDFEPETAGDDTDQKDIVQKQQGMGYPLRSEGEYSCLANPWPRDLEAEAREMSFINRRESPHTRDNAKATTGTSMVSPPQQLHLRHTS